jgi:hypothetical protein
MATVEPTVIATAEIEIPTTSPKITPDIIETTHTATETIPDWLKVNNSQDSLVTPTETILTQESTPDIKIDPILIDIADTTKMTASEDTIPDWIKNTPAMNTETVKPEIESTNIAKENKVTTPNAEERLPDWLINSLQTNESPLVIADDILADIPSPIVGESPESETVIEKPLKKIANKTSNIAKKKEEKKL